MTLSHDSDAAVSWLKIWHGEDGPWTIFIAYPDKPGISWKAKSFDDEQVLREYIDEVAGSANLYYSGNEHVRVNTTPLRAEIIKLLGLFVDIDIPKNSPHNESSLEEIYLRLSSTSIIPPPTFIICSGGGYQAGWRFPTPIDAIENYDRIEALGKTLARSFASDAIQNINRLLRLPGTINHPDASKREKGRLTHQATLVKYNKDSVWDPDNDPPIRSALHAIDTNTDAPIADMPPKWVKLVKTGDASTYNNDRSRLVFAFACAMVRKGWKNEQIAYYLYDDSFKISEHCRSQSNPKNVALRQAERARVACENDWVRSVTTGEIKENSIRNTERALIKLDYTFAYNEFSDKVIYNGKTVWRPDLEDKLIRGKIEKAFGFRPQKEAQDDAITSLALENSSHPPREYLAQVQPNWDGEKRTDTWLCRMAGVESNEYTRTASQLMLLAAVRRIKKPGTKFDHMMVFVSHRQGVGKSTTIRRLCPDEEWYSDSIPLHASEKVVIEQLAGKWIVECSELNGMKQSEIEQVKSFLSRQEDRSRLSYDRHRSDMSRQCVFFGTTNKDVFLRDTENRRFWPIFITKEMDINWLVENRDQLWGEAAILEESYGSREIELPKELWALAAEAQAAARMVDPWEDVLMDALGDRVGKIANGDVWKIIDKPAERRDPVLNTRLGDVMTDMGWERSNHPMALPGKGYTGTQRGFMRGDQEERKHWLYVYKDPDTGMIEVSDNPPIREKRGDLSW